MKFEVGDTVRLLKGTSPIVVTHVDELNRIKGRYVSGTAARTVERWRSEDDYVIYGCDTMFIADQNEAKEDKMTDKLYQVDLNGITVFANYLAVDRKGNWVMEGKSDGAVFSVSADKVEEVLPYTIKIKSIFSDWSFHVKTEEGDVGVNDVLLILFNGKKTMVLVEDVDTKHSNAKGDFEVLGRFVMEGVK